MKSLDIHSTFLLLYWLTVMHGWPSGVRKNSSHPKVSESEISSSQSLTRNFRICGSSGLFRDQAHLQPIGMIWRTKNTGTKHLLTGDHLHWQGQNGGLQLVSVVFGCYSAFIWIWMPLCSPAPLYLIQCPPLLVLYPDPNSVTTYWNLRKINFVQKGTSDFKNSVKTLKTNDIQFWQVCRENSYLCTF